MKQGHSLTLFLCGDVMTGRGIDQILPSAGDPTLHESFAKDANLYVQLAERKNGPLPSEVDFSYIWGDALEILRRVAPDLRMINLETAVTTSDDYWPGKGIHYRMSPQNAPCLSIAEIDCCMLANNHVLDWGYAGLEETLGTLKQTRLQIAGAGQNRKEAEAPAVFDLPNGTRVLVFALGSNTSGVPSSWSAGEDKPGVHLFDESSGTAIERLRKLIDSYRQPDDLVLVSIHWGPNWSYEVPWEQQNFAHALIDDCGVHLVHGHSSHHVKGIEVYHNRLILYGCGDLLTDYEGIEGYEMFRGDLWLLYFVTLDSKTGKLMNLDMQPTQMKRLQLKQASLADRDWLAGVLNREGRAWRTRVSETDHHGLTLHWD